MDRNPRPGELKRAQASPALTLHRCAAWGVGCWLLPSAIDLRAVALAAEALTGHHDFRSFTSTQVPRREPNPNPAPNLTLP